MYSVIENYVKYYLKYLRRHEPQDEQINTGGDYGQAKQDED